MSEQRFRKSAWLREYDYSQPGSYFFTVCTVDRSCFLGRIRDFEVHLSALGEIVKEAWLDISAHHPAVQLDEMVIMPNHVHGILCIQADENRMQLERVRPGGSAAPKATSSVARTPKGPGKGTLGSIIGSFKSASSRNVNEHRGTAGARVWQQNYYEHIIRDERSLDRIRAYIAANPARWEDDEENPYRNRR